MAGPDVGGSRGGHDPEKFGPIRSILKHYAKSPHPFTQCVRDNRKRFGPRTNQICAWVKDQIRGTTHWRGKEAAFIESMRQEGVPQNQIDRFLFEMDLDLLQENMEGLYPSHEEACAYCDVAGIEYNPSGYDDPCPVCASHVECDCDVDWGKLHEEHKEVNKRRLYQLVEAKTKPKKESVAPTSKTETERDRNDITLDTEKAHLVAESKNGTSVYSDGSIQNNSSGVRKYPVQVYYDGSVRYDDGSVAKPNSVAALTVIGQLDKGQRANLFAQGPGGVPVAEYADIDSVIKDAVAKTFKDSGVGGKGEMRADQVKQTNAVSQGVPDHQKPSITLPKPSGATRGSRTNSVGDPNQPVQLQRGERATRGPQGGRGVWRTVDGNPIFIKLGQTPAEAAAENRNRKKSR